MSRYHLPHEVGLAKELPPPPRPLYMKTTPKKARYCITEKDLLANGFSRQELQHIKNEVRSQ